MAIAKGSKSKFIWCEESTLNTAPSGVAYKGCAFSAESFIENINKIVSDEIRSDRVVPSIRGGNIATGGSLTTDFAPNRHYAWLKHLLCASVTATTLGAKALAAMTYIVGDIVTCNAKLYRCKVGGAVTAGDVVTGLTTSDGSDEVLTNTTWVYVKADANAAADTRVAALSATTYARGDLAVSGARMYICMIGGAVTGGDVTAGLTSTSGDESLTNTIWQYIADGAALVNKYVYTAGVDFPTGGIAIEKHLLGGDDNLYVGFTGCRINTLGLTMPQEGIVKSEWGVLAMKSTKLVATNSSSITDVTDDPFTGYEAHLSISGAVASRPVREGNLNITNNVAEDVYSWGSRFRRELPGNRREVSGQMTMYFESDDDYAAFKAETIQPAVLSFLRAGKFLSFDFPETKFTGQGTPQIAGQGVITAQYNFDVFKQSGAHDLGLTIITPTALS